MAPAVSHTFQLLPYVMVMACGTAQHTMNTARYVTPAARSKRNPHKRFATSRPTKPLATMPR